jgi:hypothetical protein
MTGFTVKGLAPETTHANPGTIVIYGSSRSVRVNHVKFGRPGTGAMKVKGLYGVVDHCYFDEPNGKGGVQVEATGFGDESFGTPANLGTRRRLLYRGLHVCKQRPRRTQRYESYFWRSSCFPS